MFGVWGEAFWGFAGVEYNIWSDFDLLKSRRFEKVKKYVPIAGLMVISILESKNFTSKNSKQIKTHNKQDIEPPSFTNLVAQRIDIGHVLLSNSQIWSRHKKGTAVVTSHYAPILFVPIGSMGLGYWPTFTIKINHSCR